MHLAISINKEKESSIKIKGQSSKKKAHFDKVFCNMTWMNDLIRSGYNVLDKLQKNS